MLEEKNQILEDLIKDCQKNLYKFDEKQIRKAFEFSIKFHGNNLRANGQLSYKHSFAVAKIMINEIKLDDTSVISALLIDIVSNNNDPVFKEITKEFGPTVAEIVSGIATITHLEKNRVDYLKQLENYRKVLFSLFKDFRIILIKLASRLNNLRNLEWLPDNYRREVAAETMELYVPYANRFGLNAIKWELEDLSFKYLNRDAYDNIKKRLNATRKERENYISKFITPLNDHLKKSEFIKKDNSNFEIYGRAKHIYSIFNKMIARAKPMEELYDLEAVRIIIDTEDENLCFYVYGILASLYPPVHNTFKDYIWSPKQNGYRSIHTAVLGPLNKPVEVQIRTRKMHEIAEEGVAAHYEYKKGLIPAQSVLNNEFAKEWMDSIREILENESDESPEQLLESVKKNVFLDEIHVFSPKNQIITIPKGATPLDFAFYIHSDLGIRCIGAKINGRIEPLEYKLNSGDQIEIITSQKAKPNKEWLEIVITSKAKSVIRKYLKAEKKVLVNEGKTEWQNLLKSKNANIRLSEYQSLYKLLNVADKDEFYQKIALGQVEINNAWGLYVYLKSVPKNPKNSNLDSIQKVDNRFTSKIHLVNKLVLVECDDIPNLSRDILENIIHLGDLSVYFVNIIQSEENNFIKFEVKIQVTRDFDLNLISEKVKSINGVKSILINNIE